MDDRDLPQDADLDRFGGAEAECRNCGRTLYDDLSVCPHCGDPVGGGEQVPKWALVTVAVLIVALAIGVLTAVLGGRSLPF